MKANNTLTQTIDVLYEDDDCAVINKPAGLLVHPLPGHNINNTLVEWWLHYPGVDSNNWPEPLRAGVVHRLDKDTSGAILLAKHKEALLFLQSQFYERVVEKHYQSLCWDKPANTKGKVTSLISRNRNNRTKRVTSLINFTDSEAKEASSLYDVLKIYTYKSNTTSLIHWQILTGRTHQIRLHAKMLNCPILGDPDYSIKPSRILTQALKIERQLLHCEYLVFNRPGDHKRITAQAPMADDILSTISKLSPNE